MKTVRLFMGHSLPGPTFCLFASLTEVKFFISSKTSLIFINCFFFAFIVALAIYAEIKFLSLLGLMSEDDKLQNEVLKSSSRLITFLALTFQRCASLCKVRKRKLENKEEDDFSAGMAEMQSLQTALTLLTQIVTQQNVPIEHWESLEASISDLKVIAEMHEEKSIKIAAGKLEVGIYDREQS